MTCGNCKKCEYPSCTNIYNHKIAERTKSTQPITPKMVNTALAIKHTSKIKKQPGRKSKNNEANAQEYFAGAPPSDQNDRCFEEITPLQEMAKILQFEKQIEGTNRNGFTGSSDRSKRQIKAILKTAIDSLQDILCVNNESKDLYQQALYELYDDNVRQNHHEKTLLKLLETGW